MAAKLRDALQTLHGIGPAGAADLAAKIIRDGRAPASYTLQQLRALLRRHYAADLPAGTQADLRYNFARNIPREVLQVFDAAIHAGPQQYRAIICGSYRRGSATSNDIDLVVRREDWPALRTALATTRGISITEPFSEGPARLETCVMITHGRTVYSVKMDVFLTSAASWPYATLYATGSKENNLYMRQRAKSRGLLLNHAGLYRIHTDKSGAPVLVHGAISHEARSKPARDEAAIYALLEMDYKPPEAR